MTVIFIINRGSDSIKKIFIIIVVCISLFFQEAQALAQCPVCESINNPVHDMEFDTDYTFNMKVLCLQKALKESGFYDGKLDGIFGAQTQHAVMNFQKQHHLKPDGVAGPVTRAVLEKNIEEICVSSETLQPEGKVDILIDTGARILHVLVNGEPFKQYTVALGKSKTPTPIGNWNIQRKALHWGTGFGTRWIGLDVPWGTYGIHGTNKPYSIGSYASHGCIRMHNKNVEEIYPWVQKDTRVVIVGNPFTYRTPSFRVMHHNSRGSDVMVIQHRLKKLGYYDGPIDGIWGGGMEKAVIKFREDKGLKYDNAVDDEVYKALGI